MLGLDSVAGPLYTMSDLPVSDAIAEVAREEPEASPPKQPRSRSGSADYDAPPALAFDKVLSKTARASIDGGYIINESPPAVTNTSPAKRQMSITGRQQRSIGL